MFKPIFIMDPEFISLQMQTMQQMMQQLKTMQQQQSVATSADARIPFPNPLNITGNMRDNFNLFKANWTAYTEATGIAMWSEQEEPKKVNILWSMVGDEAKLKYDNFSVRDVDRASCVLLLDKIESSVTTGKHTLFDRWSFYTCSQAEDEKFDEYLRRLRKAADSCDFDTILQSSFKSTMIRDRLIFGIRDENLKKQFLKEDLTKLVFEDVINRCKVNEMTDDRYSTMVSETEKAVHKMKATPLQKKLCKFCGSSHPFTSGSCPAFSKMCNICKKTGHFAKCCYSKNKRPNKMHCIGADADDDTASGCEASLFKLDTKNKKKGPKAVLELMIRGYWKEYECDMDSGADVCVVGFQNLCKLLMNKNPRLDSSDCNLKAFGGTNIEVLGMIAIPCRHKGRKYKIHFQVVNVDHGFLLSESTCLALGLIKYCRSISTMQCYSKNVNSLRMEAGKIVDSFGDVFEGYGKLPGKVKLEIDSNVQPVIQKPRRIPVALKEKLKEELDKLEKDNIVTKVETHTEWVSNILLVQKPDSFRICIDPIPLNKALKRPNLQFTTMDEVLPELSNAKVFSTVDAKKGFWQLELNYESSLLTTFWTPFGRYRWNRLPFGVSPAPELFQMKIREMTHDLEGIEIMADDMLIYGCGETLEDAMVDHNRKLKLLLERCQRWNCKLNRSKMFLCEPTVKFYGYTLSEEGIKPDSTKIEAIANFPQPENKGDLQRFLGMTNYLSRFIPNLSMKNVELRKLLLENTQWIWSEMADSEFKQLKKIIISTEGLKYYNVGKPVEIHCDASSVGLGAAVFQNNKPVAFASRQLSKAEQNYAMIEKELLAIVFACVRFDQLIVGNPSVTIRTDHKPLTNIFKNPLLKAPKRLQLMLMILQRYTFDLKFVCGKENIVADTLSRAAMKLDDDEFKKQMNRKNIFSMKAVHEYQIIQSLDVSTDTTNMLRQETSKDESFKVLISYIIHGWPLYIKDVDDSLKCFFKFKHELTIQDGLIFRLKQVVIPKSLRKCMINKAHVSHSGIENTIKFAKENIFWPGMCQQIEEKVRQCDPCAKFAESQQNLPMMSHEIPIYAWQIISMDVFFVRYRNKQEKMLVMVDHFSDFFECCKLPDLTPQSVINIMKEQFARYGVPEKVVSDNGTHFVSREMKQFASKYGFKHVTSSPYHQQGNGKAESAVKTAKRIIVKADIDNEDMWWCLLHWRNTPNKIGSSPVQRLMSKKTRCGLPAIAKSFTPEIVSDVPDKIEANKKRAKYYYDQSTKTLPDLEVGQGVQVQLRPDTKKTWSKGFVKDKLSSRSYVVDVEGTPYRRDRINIRASGSTNSSDGSINQDMSGSTEVEFPSERYALNESPVATPTCSSTTALDDSTPLRRPIERPRRLTRPPVRLADYDCSQDQLSPAC